MADSSVAHPVSLIEQAEQWIVRLASGSITADELTAFEAWLARSDDHRAAFAEARALWRSLKRDAGNVVPLTGGRSRRAARHGWRWATAVAAGVAALLAGPDALVHLRATHVADTGEIRRLTLPDGSRALLDSGAAIAVRYDGSERQVALLRGRGWFDVRHGDHRPFRVQAGDGVTRDIGTAFEIARDDGGVQVAVTDGAVQVSTTNDTTGLRLHARQRVRYASNGPMRRLPDATADMLATWRYGRIVFDRRPLSEAVGEIARYRRGTVMVMPGAGDAAISGTFRTDSPDAALGMIADMAGMRLIHLPAGMLLLAR